MNTANNERYKSTRQKILQAYGVLAFSKAIDKITVSDICKEAGIHRTTFYGHFQDMMELEFCVISEQFQHMLENFETENGWNFREGVLSQLTFYYNNMAMVKRNCMNSSFDRADSVFADIISKTLADSYMKHYNLKSKTELDYHQSFITTGFISIIKKWVSSDCKETPEEIADIICKILRED